MVLMTKPNPPSTANNMKIDQLLKNKSPLEDLIVIS